MRDTTKKLRRRETKRNGDDCQSKMKKYVLETDGKKKERKREEMNEDQNQEGNFWMRMGKRGQETRGLTKYTREFVVE